jgi:hypothetical protein
MAGIAGDGSSSKHVWFQGLQQQQQQQGAEGVMPFVEASAGGSMGKASGSAGGSSAVNTSNGYAVLSSSSYAVQQGGDSRRSSLCESSTSSSMMVAPVAGAGSMQLSGNNVFNSSAQNSVEMGPLMGGAGGVPATAAAAAANGSSSAGLSDLSRMRMLVSSLMTEIQNTRQEAMDNRNAAVQAQQQLKAITEAFSAAGGPGVPADVAAAQAVQMLGGSAAAATAASRDQLQQQQQQQVMMQRVASGMPHYSEAAAAAAAGLQLAGSGMAHTVSNGSGMSCSGNWAAAAAADALARLPAISAALAASTAPDAAVASLEQAVAHRLSLERAAAAAAQGNSSEFGRLPAQSVGHMPGYAFPGSYAVVAGNDGVNAAAGTAAGVLSWLQLLPAAQGLDGVTPMTDFSSELTAGGSAGFATGSAAGVSATGSWRNSFEAAPVVGLAPAAAAAVYSQSLMTGSGSAPLTMALPLGANPLQQQQQSTADYLLQLQQQHGMLSPSAGPFMMSGGLQQPNNMQQLQQAMQQQQQQQVMRSAPVMLQGWGGNGRVMGGEDGVHSGGSLQGVLSPSVDVPPGYTTAGGNRQLGWL